MRNDKRRTNRTRRFVPHPAAAEKPLKLGLYGGTFDPPHIGHFQAAGFALQALELDKLLFMPTCQPPHKAQGSASAEHRLAMAALMADALCAEGNAEGYATASDLEIRRGGASYTYETVDAVLREYPHGELWLIMGSDMFLTLHNWRKPEQFLPRVRVAAFSRGAGVTQAQLEAQQTRLSATFGLESVILELPELIELSSSDLRAELKPASMLPQVYGYILNHRLYGVTQDRKALSLEQLRCASYAWIRARRIPHVQGTEETAAWLAAQYGADAEKARRAAILHDLTKHLTKAEQLKLVEKYDIVLDDYTRRTEKLLHAKTGAAVAREEYGADADIESAIFWHTTGHGNMTTLEKIIYLADYIEPTREFEEAEALRAAAQKSLDEAVRMGLALSADEILAKGRPVHPDTLAALESLKEG